MTMYVVVTNCGKDGLWYWGMWEDITQALDVTQELYHMNHELQYLVITLEEAKKIGVNNLPR